MKLLHRFTAIELRDAFIRGDVSAVEIAEHYLKRIDRFNPKLGSFLQTLAPQALRKAEALDLKRSKNLPLGKMAAIPIGIKDNMHISGEITTSASQILRNYRAPFSATAVELMEEADALFIGKMNLDEFAMGSANENSSFFPAHNPWNLRCVPGGSSGGSASAVAARLCPMATGTDTGGSIRQPASFCGIVGFKPTYGRVSRHGLIALGSSLDQIGPMAVSVADAALMMEVIGRHCPKDATSLDLPPESYPLSTEMEEVKIGVPWKFIEGLKEETRLNFFASLDVMKSLGAQIVDIDLGVLKHSIAVYYIVSTAEASTNLARFDGIRFGARSPHAKTLDDVYEMSRKEGLGFEVKKRIFLGSYVLSAGFQDAYYKKAQKVRTLIIDAFDRAFQSCDAVAIPVAPTGAFEHGSIHDPLEMYLQDMFTVPANLAGLPAISIPSGFDSRGMPLGFQLIGPQMCDVPLMQYGYAFEQKSRQSLIPPAYDVEVS